MGGGGRGNSCTTGSSCCHATLAHTIYTAKEVLTAEANSPVEGGLSSCSGTGWASPPARIALCSSVLISILLYLLLIQIYGANCNTTTLHKENTSCPSRGSLDFFPMRFDEPESGPSSSLDRCANLPYLVRTTPNRAVCVSLAQFPLTQHLLPQT